MYLAIDTSTNTAGLALIANGHLVAEDTWCCTRNHSVELLSHTISLLTMTSVDIRDITGIIVARGPGGFNGLRVGLGTAKGLAFGLDVPIVGISTLAAAAYQHAAAGLPVCAVLPAGRTEVAWAIFQGSSGKWQGVLPETVSLPSDIYHCVNSPTIFAGELSENLLHEVRDKFDMLAIIPTQAPISRACALAELGTQRLSEREEDNVATIQPLYLRRPPITQPKSKAAGLRPPHQ